MKLQENISEAVSGQTKKESPTESLPSESQNCSTSDAFVRSPTGRYQLEFLLTDEPEKWQRSHWHDDFSDESLNAVVGALLGMRPTNYRVSPVL